jgi:hypothetical protein
MDGKSRQAPGAEAAAYEEYLTPEKSVTLMPQNLGFEELYVAPGGASFETPTIPTAQRGGLNSVARWHGLCSNGWTAG